MGKAELKQLFGDNINYKVSGNLLLITLDLSKDFGKSSTGANTLVANSKGFREIEDKPGYKMNLCVIRK